jgi:carbonic anhydrase
MIVVDACEASPMSMREGSCTADEVLARLVAGNERFIHGEARFPTVPRQVLAELAKAQRPYATILGCSDSRVPPELVFDAGFGKLFVVRVAGNVVSPEVMGTLQYAGMHLRTPLFLVLGHEGCGAVQAALAAQFRGARDCKHIAVLLKSIRPGLRGVNAELAPHQQLRAAVEANVRWSIRQLLDTPEVRARKAEGVMKLVGAVFELTTGRVRFLPDSDGAGGAGARQGNV